MKTHGISGCTDISQLQLVSGTNEILTEDDVTKSVYKTYV
jgi:hypothetical protein